MRDRKVASRYAGALLLSARAEGVLTGVADSFAAVVQLVEDHRDMQTFLDSPQVAEQEKKDLLRNVLADRIEPVLLKFFYLLIDKNRIENLQDIGEEFASLVELELGTVRASVVTAVPLADDLAAGIETKLQAMTGKSIILEKKVDPGVIGGVCVTVGDKILDGTIRTNLDKLRGKLEKTAVR